MADDTKSATLRSNITQGSDQVKVTNNGTNVLDATLEVAAAASAGSVYTLFRIPTNARIHRGSVIEPDALADTGSPTLDIGLKAVRDNITTDDDALNDGIDAKTAAASAIIGDHADYGKMAWEFTSEDADPGGLVDVIVTIKDAATNTGGTLSATIIYSVD